MMYLVLHVIPGFWICLGLALVLIRLAPALGLMDIPRGRRQHAHPVPLVGGLAVILAILVWRWVHSAAKPMSQLELSIVVAMGLLGLLDDRFDLRAKWKAFLGLVAALVLAHFTCGQVAQYAHPIRFLGAVLAPTSWAIFPLLVLMYWGLPHGFNLIDGANGLAMGFSLVVLGSLWAAGYPHGFLFGALLACLILNWPHAKLFLGDCGSLSMGLMLVLVAKDAFLLQNPGRILWLFVYPTLDVTMVVLIRLLQGKNPGVGDRNHMHFQLKDRWPGMKNWAVPFLLGLAALCASRVYLPPAWSIIPHTGLFLFAAMAVVFGIQSLSEARGLPGYLGKELEVERMNHPSQARVGLVPSSADSFNK